MVAGKEIRTLVGVFGDWGDLTGRRHQVGVSWTGQDGLTEFSEQYELDLEVLTALPESPPKGLHTIAEEIEQLRGAINQLRGSSPFS